MPTAVTSVAKESKAMIVATAICNSLEDLISDYAILVGAFSFINPQVRESFSSRGFATSEKLLALEDRARTLKSHVSKAEQRQQYEEAARIQHVNERQDISMAFLELSENLRELKKYLEGSYPFKYLPGCSYKLLGELGTPSITPTQRAGEHQVPNTQTATTAEPSTNSQLVANPSSHDTTFKPESALDDATEIDPMQSPQKTERRSTRVRKRSAKSAKENDSTISCKGTPRAIKLYRPRSWIAMGIAKKVANTRLSPENFSFGHLALDIKTPQQIWSHRFPEGWNQTASEEYACAIEQQRATARLKLKLQAKSKTELAKKLKVVKADNAKLERETHFAKVVFAQREEEALSMTEKIQELEKTINKLRGGPGLRLSLKLLDRDTKSKTKVNSKRQVNESAEDKKQDFRPSDKRRRIS
ncbi:hypothetical protein DL95DRAFT_483979 [Leptodontidium sp. 2 PMI_412]|nr:hypothetical protein DL95DRAFT_483979 [Leptodontidium sp. 2 PMI_412]